MFHTLKQLNTAVLLVGALHNDILCLSVTRSEKTSYCITISILNKARFLRLTFISIPMLNNFVTSLRAAIIKCGCGPSEVVCRVSPYLGWHKDFWNYCYFLHLNTFPKLLWPPQIICRLHNVVWYQYGYDMP